MKNKSTANSLKRVYYLSLGSNLGDRSRNLEQAGEFLRGIGDVLKVSRVYETEPVGMAAGTRSFYNLALSLSTSLEPLELLDRIKEFESGMGRDRARSHNRPRTIDIDILMVENRDNGSARVMNTERLDIPHKEMTARAFVLIPLNDIAPDVVHPTLNQTVKELLADLETNEGVQAVNWNL
ncbi:MAG: 2-amino-4-hydroxy-6-hydroxymethyldihydropteridine diphosphokinase [bacterium]|nr:2-amino-4-hydroxy-6-hydroxymethyldihydropteridine diphosphokinase [bacterium]